MSSKKRIKFTTVKEDWNEYQLDNGTILKVKIPIAAIIMDEKGTGLLYNITSYVDPSEEDHGPPSSGFEKVDESDVIEEVKFSRVRESINIYETEGKNIIILHERTSSIRRTSKFDSKGVRNYRFNSNALVSVVPYPKELMEKRPAATQPPQSQKESS